ncbi:MAG: hemerythrin domain-containing protein [Eubacteriales bacterium]|nr:hemerythrin domain-containing protein [Eubacteriales bacterium]
MYAIETMVAEHRQILRLATTMEQACIDILDGKQLVTADFRAAIDFIRGYADRHHHGKEEQFLFNEMASRLGPVAEKMIKHGMLSEHNLARYQVVSLEAALDHYDQHQDTLSKLKILSHMMAYVDLIRGHIVREDTAVYPFAESKLSPEILQVIDAKTRGFETDTSHAAEAARLLLVLGQLEAIYPVKT